MINTPNSPHPNYFTTFIFYALKIIIIILWGFLAACGILVPHPGIEPMTPAVKVQSLNHWTAREVLYFY